MKQWHIEDMDAFLKWALELCEAEILVAQGDVHEAISRYVSSTVHILGPGTRIPGVKVHGQS